MTAKLSRDALAAKLQDALGPDAVTLEPQALSSHTVDGQEPVVICTPSNAEQVTAALRVCAEAEAAVVPWGGGTAVALGNIPSRLDVVMRLKKLDNLVEHDDANLTATLEAGMTLSLAQQMLKQRNQFLPIDAPQPERATLGGVVAANTNGPRRMAYGGVRDLVIGMKTVLANGEQIKAGGKVVKNVAGYDMCKLFVGSLGTLGIIAELTFKVAPLSECAVTVVARGSLADCSRLSEQLRSSLLLPSAVTIANAGTSKGLGLSGERSAIFICVEGFQEAVQRHHSDLQSMAKQIGLACEILEQQSHFELWRSVCDFAANGNEALYRLTVPLSSVGAVLVSLEQWGAAIEPPQMIAHAGSGTILVRTIADRAGNRPFAKLTALAQQHKGHAVMMAAPPGLKEGIDVWGAPAPGIALMRKLKSEFDPQGLLNPGRFIGHM